MFDDEKYMRRCIQLAENGRQNARPNPMVGAVIVADGNSLPSSPSPWEGCGGVVGGLILGEGYHVRCGEGHAEVNAFASVRPEDEPLLKDATIYVSLEPCAHYGKTPPCCDLIIRKGVRRVVVGCVDPFAEVQGRGIQKIREAGIDVTVGVLEKECQWLNRRFFTFHKAHRPYIILKWAQTSDGFLDDHGRAVSISTPFTQMLSHRLRAEEDAILVGRITDEREHPQLTVRAWSGKNPERFVLSHETSIEEILQQCYERNLQSLIVEGGAQTHQSFIEKGLYDEIRVETNTLMTVGAGTAASLVPTDVELFSSEHFDSNTIEHFRHL